MKKYEHYISLGSFCSVALELERIGLRETSSPFDWLISDFEGVIRAIDNHFADWLNYDNMLQNIEHKMQYKDEFYGCQFFHDFNEIEPLENQIDEVREKYKRRIERFYRIISEPTMFIRYIKNTKTESGENKELIYIEENYEYILKIIKLYNSNNDIIFIANNEVKSHIIKIYNVEKDKNDVVSRAFLEKNDELKILLCECDYERRDDNLRIYRRKKRKDNRRKILKRLKKKLNNKEAKEEYLHSRQYTS